MVNEERWKFARQEMHNYAHMSRELAIGNLATLPLERSLRRIVPRAAWG